MIATEFTGEDHPETDPWILKCRIKANGFTVGALRFVKAVEVSEEQIAQIVPSTDVCRIDANAFAVSDLRLFVSSKMEVQQIAKTDP